MNRYNQDVKDTICSSKSHDFFNVTMRNLMTDYVMTPNHNDVQPSMTCDVILHTSASTSLILNLLAQTKETIATYVTEHLVLIQLLFKTASNLYAVFHGVVRAGDKYSRFLYRYIFPHVISTSLTETYEQAFDSTRGQVRRTYFKDNITKQPTLIQLTAADIPVLVDFETKRRTVLATKYVALRLGRNVAQKRKHKQSTKKNKKQRLV